MIEREREREREREKKKEREREREIEIETETEKSKPFSGDFTWFCQLELDRPRVKVALRDENYVWVLESQDFVKVQGSGFHENREKDSVSGNHAN